MTSTFLNDLVTLEARGLYDFYLGEIKKNLPGMNAEEASRNALQLLKHYAAQPNLDLDSMVS